MTNLDGTGMKHPRDHIFISYATEQSSLCDWLARRLAAKGYAIWCDRQKLLGGENWINDINVAIDKRTFRMIALLSRDSLSKPNPQGEWQKGLAIGKALGIQDFVIPLNTDGLRSDEITWNFQPINYIPFTPSWAEGLTKLTKKLEAIDAPRVLTEGPRLAVESTTARSAVRNESESLLSNCFEITQIPRFVRKYETSSNLSTTERRGLQREWACRDVSPNRVLAFEDPPSGIYVNQRFRCVDQVSWRDTEFLDEIDSRHLVVSLIHRCLDQLLRNKGLKYTVITNSWSTKKKTKQWYLPRGVLDNNRVSFTFPSGKWGWFNGIGQRTFPTAIGGEVYRYHLSPTFSVLRDQSDPFVLLLRNRVYLTDAKDIPLKGQKIVSRRKHLCKGWFNYEWCARTLGIAQLLADEDMYIRFGSDAKQQLVISAIPIVASAPQCIEDELVDEPDGIYTNWHEGDEMEFYDGEGNSNDRYVK